MTYKDLRGRKTSTLCFGFAILEKVIVHPPKQLSPRTKGLRTAFSWWARNFVAAQVRMSWASVGAEVVRYLVAVRQDAVLLLWIVLVHCELIGCKVPEGGVLLPGALDDKVKVVWHGRVIAAAVVGTRLEALPLQVVERAVPLTNPALNIPPGRGRIAV